tara:strand:- start:501 stop:803 length:303 start_codon:yes stop_codon:yes gene_type:complete
MTTLIINAQYYENYAIGPNGLEGAPYWKPKGGHEFVINGFDPDDLFYDEENVVSAIKSLVANQSNDYEKFEYISHELKFGEPTEIKLNDYKSEYAETNRV